MGRLELSIGTNADDLDDVTVAIAAARYHCGIYRVLIKDLHLASFVVLRLPLHQVTGDEDPGCALTEFAISCLGDRILEVLESNQFPDLFGWHTESIIFVDDRGTELDIS